MKSTAGKELHEKAEVLKKLSIAFSQFDKHLQEARSGHDIEKVKTVIEKSTQAQEVAIHIRKTMMPISSRLNEWIDSIKEKYFEAPKYHDMSERIGVFVSIDCELEELEEVCLPKITAIPSEADEFEEFVEDLDNLVFDLMLYVDDALSDIAYIQDGTQFT